MTPFEILVQRKGVKDFIVINALVIFYRCGELNITDVDGYIHCFSVNDYTFEYDFL